MRCAARIRGHHPLNLIPFNTAPPCPALPLPADCPRRYYILATRYGRYSTEEFSLDARPGRRYWMKAWRAAMMFQRAWDRYWAIAKLRRHRASRRIQTVWRRYWALKTVAPLYRIARHFSRHSTFLYFFQSWREYHGMCRRVKGYVAAWVYTMVPECFAAWKSLQVARRAWIEARHRRADFKARNGRMLVRMAKWRRYVVLKKRQRGMLRRVLEVPQFGMWLHYVAREKQRKRLDRAFAAFYRLIQNWLRRRSQERRDDAAHTMTHFLRWASARRRTDKVRAAAIAREFDEYRPRELRRRAAKANDRETSRLQREEAAVKDAERRDRQQLKKFLLEDAGRMQVTRRALPSLLPLSLIVSCPDRSPQVKEMVQARGGPPAVPSLLSSVAFYSRQVRHQSRPIPVRAPA